VALAAVVFHREGILILVVAGSAGFTRLHVGHGGFQCAGLVGEDLGVAIGTLIGLEMEVVTEVGFTRIGLEGDLAWFQSLVALCTVTG